MHPEILRDAALGPEPEPHGLGRVEGGVAHEQRREPAVAEAGERLLRADPDRAEVERAERRGQHALPRQGVHREIAECGASGIRQHPGQGGHPQELLLVLLFPPDGVVEVLAPARGIHADGEDVRVLGLRDPDVLPRRRDGEVADARPLGSTGQAAVAVHVGEPAAAPHPGEPR